METKEKVKSFKPGYVNEDVIAAALNFSMCKWDILLNQENWPFAIEASETN